MNADSDDIIDHKNHDTLNNRKYNLGCTTQTRNMMNRKGANSNTTSGERNVCWVKANQKWRVQLQVNGKCTNFGEFNYDDLDKAIALARKKREEIYKLKKYLAN
jgi:hypothetical protein